MVANNPNDEAERRFLLSIQVADAIMSTDANLVRIQRALVAGYITVAGPGDDSPGKYRLTHEGRERLDELTDR